MSKNSWHKRYHSDAISGYMGLSLEERGAYATLKDYIYDRQGPLPGNMRLLAGYLDCSVRKTQIVVESLITKGKLYRLDDGRISNHRCDKELISARSQADHKAEIGSRGGKKSAEVWKKARQNNDGRQRPLGSGSTDARSQKPEPESTSVAKATGAGAPPLPGLEPVKPEKKLSKDEQAKSDLYRRGREILGKGGGSTVSNLLKCYDGNARKALNKLEDAADKRDPAAWLHAYMAHPDVGWGKELNFDRSPAS